MEELAEDLLPLSGLQHLVFCERQCALIHVEGLWEENVLTTEGAISHQRVDSGLKEVRRDVQTHRNVWVQSRRLGLVGRIDLVEVQIELDPPRAEDTQGIDGPSGVLFPIEYKRGKPREDLADETQLCAGAMALEEMTGAKVPGGAIFYHRIRKRVPVQFSAQLRRFTSACARRFHRLIADGRTPSAEYTLKCRSCSLFSVCLPDVVSDKEAVSLYVRKHLED